MFTLLSLVLNFLALNNNDIWSEGLLVFYEIFRYLEENVSENILPREYHRKEEFEKDLDFYKGPDWKKTYKIRVSVQKYLNHLYEINEKNPLLLIAFCYHLYMGLLSGGQILSKKRKLANKLIARQRDDDVIEPGNHLTSFPNKSILEMKNKFRHIIDEFSKDFDEELRGELIVESKMVFELNNDIIKSIEGVGAQLTKNLMSCLGYFSIAVLSIYLFYKLWNF